MRMDIELTEYMKRLREKSAVHLSPDDQAAFLTLAFAPKECGIEEDMCRYMDEHPDATWQELNTYMTQLLDEK